MPADVVGALRSLTPCPDAKGFERQVQAALESLGFAVTPQFGVPYYADADGFIDLLAERDGFRLALELDRVGPREKSVGKLQLVEGFRAVLLREAGGPRPCPDGLDLVMGLGAGPVDLFGVPLPRPKAKKGGKPTPGQQEAASRVVDAYQAQVRPDHRRTVQADRNAAYWIADGQCCEQDLLRAVAAYARHCDEAGRDGLYRKSAANFFGRRDPYFRAYLKEKVDGAATAGQRQRFVGPGHSRLRGDPADDYAGVLYQAPVAAGGGGAGG